MALAGSRAVANPRAGGHACGYSQGEGDVLTLGHGAVQRDFEGLVGLCVTLSPREVYLYLVMEDCREKIETSADQSLWKHHSPQKQAIQSHRRGFTSDQVGSAHTRLSVWLKKISSCLYSVRD